MDNFTLPLALNGLVNINKPEGITSMQVVRRLKRASKQKKVGHGGTLDPIASGVLVICFGQATRVMDDIINGPKSYRTTIKLGVSTDTYDAEGTVLAEKEIPKMSDEFLENTLSNFVGSIEQIPPMYSALKKNGARLYELARRGIEVQRDPRLVNVQSITIVGWDNPYLTIDIDCGRGFYVRSLAHDIGESLICGGHMNSLVRTRSGPFYIQDAMSLNDAENFLVDGNYQMIQSPDLALHTLDAITLKPELVSLALTGRSFPIKSTQKLYANQARCRVYTEAGKFIGILRFDEEHDLWHPHKIFTQN